MLRRRAAKVALLLQQQALQQSLTASMVSMVHVAAMHTGVLPPAAEAPEQAAVMLGRESQHWARHVQGFHAAAEVEVPHRHQTQLLEQPSVEGSYAPQQSSQQRSKQTSPIKGRPWATVGMSHAVMSNTAVDRDTVSTRSGSGSSSSSSSSSHIGSMCNPQQSGGGDSHDSAAGAGWSLHYGTESHSEPEVGDIFEPSSLQQHYQHTLAALHAGRSRNLDQLAHMFDPQVALAAPDGGVAMLEALMFAAAKLRDLQLLRQLLRCMAAAGHAISTTGHTAVLHGLAGCGRSREALEWLQLRVPEQQLTPHLVRSLVQALLKQRDLQAVQQALDYAEPKLQQRWLQQVQHVRPASGAAAAAQQLSLRDMQELACLRLQLAGSKGTVAAVQQQWATIQRQAVALQQQLLRQQARRQHRMTDKQVEQQVQAQQHNRAPPELSSQQQQQQQQQQEHLALLGVPVWSSYVVALSKVVRHSQRHHEPADGALRRLKAATLDMMDRYHASVWDSHIQQQAAAVASHQHLQEQGPSAAAVQAPSSDAAGSVQQLQWLLDKQQLARRLWQQQLQHAQQELRQAQQMSWQDLNAVHVLPQQVVATGSKAETELCRQALNAAVTAMAGEGNGQAVQQLLQLASLLKYMPRSHGFEALLQLRYQQGAPPETLEELLGEMMGWGVIPTVAAYEQLMEAYALHRDLGAAEGVLDRLLAAGHHPVLLTYNRLLHGVALNGDLAVAIRVYTRMKLQGLQPDMQTMRCLFKCVRIYAANVRVATARAIAQCKAGDRESVFNLLSQRSALFASAYSQLAAWQRDMVAAGLKHTPPSMTHLTAALERLGALEDCLQLAKLLERARPGETSAHRAALQIAGRTRDAWVAGKASKLAEQLDQMARLGRQEYMALINSQFWLTQDHQQLLETVATMKAAGHDLTPPVLQQLLHVYCHNGMWGEALQVLADVSAGRFSPSDSSSSPSSSSPSSQGVDKGHSQGTAGVSLSTLGNDKLWHVVMRKLWERRASDTLLNQFLQHMPAKQLQRFKLLYGLQLVPGQPGHHTLQPLEDWQLPLQKGTESQQQQQQQQPQQQVPAISQQQQEMIYAYDQRELDKVGDALECDTEAHAAVPC